MREVLCDIQESLYVEFIILWVDKICTEKLNSYSSREVTNKYIILVPDGCNGGWWVW